MPSFVGLVRWLKRRLCDQMRLDQWLWAVRIFKTRTQAAVAIRNGRVSIGDRATKPAHEVQSGEVIVARVHGLTRTVRVLGEPSSRVGAKLVSQYIEDLTPPEEYERKHQRNLLPPGFRMGGTGRPTKRERRKLHQLSESEE